MGITPQALARERGLQRVGAYALSNAGRMPRRQHPDFGESTRERSDRLRQPVGPAQLRQVNDPGDGLAGAVPQYTYGQLT
jgi:hypothetical protein